VRSQNDELDNLQTQLTAGYDLVITGCRAAAPPNQCTVAQAALLGENKNQLNQNIDNIQVLVSCQSVNSM